jgi:hypothetical protein
MKPVVFTKLDLECADADREFMLIADSDLHSAEDQPTLWRKPSVAALLVYDELIRREEARADWEAQEFGSAGLANGTDE